MRKGRFSTRLVINEKISFIAIISLIIILWLAASDSILYRRIVVADAAQFVATRPVGQITDGTNIAQVISADSFKSEPKVCPNSIKDVCLKIFMANYCNRKNKGTIRISLEQNSFKVFRNLDMSSIKDNKFHMVSFVGEKLNGFSFIDDLLLRIVGIDGKDGSSVTAWLTQDITKGIAYVNGLNTGMSLICSLQLKSNSDGISIPALSLFYTYLVLLVMLILKNLAWSKPSTEL